ncbi:hypothetical protein QF030_000422 [Streptomyces rishiriensis]|uniref:Transposase IS110-like N-terminal domain-containing protein n=1 Tax=Streptomyces rishiriensis TaxID=68264 RepID=A0ABU0NGL1_STRRH|nr:hypothetical protein [Streptomyces rishiriensis]
MRRIADLYPGEAKTDARDAVVIADTALTMPHTPRSLELTDEIATEITVLVGFDAFRCPLTTAPDLGTVQTAACERPPLQPQQPQT